MREREHLVQADRLIAECKNRIARQRDDIASSFQNGHATEVPVSMLRAFEASLRAFETHRQLILDRQKNSPEAGAQLHEPFSRISAPRALPVPENSIGGDSRLRGESGQHHMRCLPSSICLRCSSPTCSNRGGSWKSRISFFVTSSTSPLPTHAFHSGQLGYGISLPNLHRGQRGTRRSILSSVTGAL
jgi:hypothetical protein